jgi:hypothetical protein
MTRNIGSWHGDAPSISSVSAISCLVAPGLALALALPAAAQEQHAHMSMHRDTLTSGTATGTPSGGTWSDNTSVAGGTTIGTLSIPDTSADPATLSLPDPPNPNAKGAPSQGGQGKYTVNYTVNGQTVQGKGDDPFTIPTFGMSCYYTALESDWGDPTVKNGCKSVTIKGHRYSGTITDPDGYKGTYCASFIGEVQLQGSGTLNSGQNIQYEASTNTIHNVTDIRGHDGSPVIAGQTVARSLSIIPAKHVKISLDQIGNDLSANDTGGDITNYRIDIYEGAGQGVCAGYNNVMSIAACQPKQPLCSVFQFPTGG